MSSLLSTNIAVIIKQLLVTFIFLKVLYISSSPVFSHIYPCISNTSFLSSFFPFDIYLPFFVEDMDFQLKNPVSSPVNQIYFSKIAIRILLALSVFSFLFSQSLPLHLFLSTFSSKLFSFSTERNYIFLLCNGVILVIIKTSGSSARSGVEGSRNKNGRRNIHAETLRNNDKEKNIHAQPYRNNDKERNIHNEAFRNNNGEQNDRKSCNKSFTSNTVLIVEAKTEITETIEKGNNVTRLESDENEVKIEDENDKILERVKELEEQQSVDTRGWEEENEGLLSLEELNKKCEDFIRKMKQEIII